MENLAKTLGKGAFRNLVTRPINTAVGGLGSGIEFLNKLNRYYGGSEQEDVPEVLPTINSLEERELKYVPKGYEGLIRPAGQAEEIADIALSGLNPTRLPKSLPDLIKLARSNLASSAGSKIAEKLGAGPLGQIAGSVIGNQTLGTKGKIPELAKSVQRNLYAKAAEVGSKNFVKPSIVSPLREHISARLKDLEKGVHSPSKVKIHKQGNDILSKLGKKDVDINDIVGVTQDLNTFVYDSNMPAYEKKFYSTILPKLKDAIKEYGKEVVEHGEPYQQALDVTKLIKKDLPTLTDTGFLKKIIKPASFAKNLLFGEEPVHNIVRFAATGKDARKALWDLQLGIIQDDKNLLGRSFNQINVINKRQPKEKQKKDIFEDIESIEYLN